MQESKFNNFYKALMENMTAGSVMGSSPSATQFSADTYAPGDTRMPKVLGIGGKGKKKKKFPIIRRRFPVTM
jgi:hypothetical protein